MEKQTRENQRRWAPQRSRSGWATEHQALMRRTRGLRIPPWSIPLAYSVGAIVMGLVLPRIESRWLPGWGLPLSTSAAIAIDSSVASGMIALTGIVFALAFVMVQFGSVAYSPRLVPWIAGDPILMHSIGIFNATFLYALAALAWVDRRDSVQVPFLSTAFVVILLVVSVGVFVGLVQRLSSLQVHRVLIFAAEQGRRVIDGLYPPLDASPATRVDAESFHLPLTQTLTDTGRPMAIQAIDTQALFDLACASGGLIEMVSAVGDTVGEGKVLLRVYGAREKIAESELLRAIVLGNERTFEQDPKYAILILADIAIRALSPAINDPATAVQALDHIEDLLLRVGRRRLESGDFRDQAGEVRLILPVPEWEDFLNLGLAEIRHYGADSLRVMRRMRALLADLLVALPSERRRSLRQERDRLDAIINRTFEDDEEILLASVEDRQGLGASRRPHVGA